MMKAMTIAILIDIIQRICLESNRGQQTLVEKLCRMVAREHRASIDETELEAVLRTDDDMKFAARKKQMTVYFPSELGRQTTLAIRRRAEIMFSKIKDIVLPTKQSQSEQQGPSLGQTLREMRNNSRQQEQKELDDEIKRITEEKVVPEGNSKIPMKIRIRILAKKLIQERKEEEKLMNSLICPIPTTLQLNILKIINHRASKKVLLLNDIVKALKDDGHYATVQPSRQLVLHEALELCHILPDIFRYRSLAGSIAFNTVGCRQKIANIIINQSFNL